MSFVRSRQLPGGRRAAYMLVATLLAVATTTGCAKQNTPAASYQPSPIPLPSCTPAAVPPQNWPIEVPADLIKPKSSKIAQVSEENNVTVVRFDTGTSLREGLIELLKGLQAKGYQIGRGDAEAREADVPFARQGVRGIFKMISIAECHTTWVLGIVRSGGPGSGPVLPGFSPPPSAQPLPFVG